MRYHRISAAIALCFSSSVALSDVVSPNSQNSLNYSIDRNFFDANGTYKPPGSAITVGDHIVGILNVRNTSVGGRTVWTSAVQDQLSGIFALRIISLAAPPDPYNSKQTSASHVVFGPPSATNFCRNSDCFSTGA